MLTCSTYYDCKFREYNLNFQEKYKKNSDMCVFFSDDITIAPFSTKPLSSDVEKSQGYLFYYIKGEIVVQQNPSPGG